MTTELPLPPMHKRLANGFLAIVRNLDHAAHHRKMVITEEDHIKRFDVCKSCAFYTLQAACSHPKCGCFLRVKTWLKAETCPEGKW